MRQPLKTAAGAFPGPRRPIGPHSLAAPGAVAEAAGSLPAPSAPPGFEPGLAAPATSTTHA